MLELQQAYALKTKPNRPQTELQEQLLALNNTIDPNWWVNDVPNDIHTNYTYGPKLAVMMSIIKTSIELDEKLLVFSNSRLELTLIELFLKADNSNWKLENTYYRMDGTVPVIKRNEYCETFNDPNSPIKLFLLTNKVGGLGLNLTGANRAIIMDVSWNPSLDTQSIFRIYRLGQKKPCFVYRFIAKGTMEEVIYDRSVTKQAISGRVVDKMQITRHFKSFEIEEMYRCDLEKRPRPMLKLPKDDVLANLLKQHTCIYSYEDHKELLQNLPDEELDEDEMKLAWEEYEKEKNFVPKPYPISPSTSGVNASFTSRVDKFPAAIQPTSNVEKNYSSTPISKTIADQNQAQDPLIMFETDKGSVIARFTPDGEIVPDKPCNVTPEQIQTAKDLKIGPQTGLSRVFVIAANGNLKNFNQWRIPRRSKRFTPRQKNLVVSEVINLADDNSDASTISNEIAENVIDIPIIELDD